MLTWAMNTFALDRDSAKAMLKAAWLAFLNNVAFMMPLSLFCMALLHWLGGDGLGSTSTLLTYAGCAVLIYLVLLLTQKWLYQATFIRTYAISAKQRLNLAAHLKELPLSFFGMRNLSDLAKTIMTDTTTLEQGYSHAVPQMIGCLLSTLLIALGMMTFHFKLGLALLWPLPVAGLIFLLTKKLIYHCNDAHKDAELIQSEELRELLETVPSIRATRRESLTYNRFAAALEDAERKHILSECALSIPLAAANLLRLGLPVIMLVSVSELASRGATLWQVLCFLLAAGILYEGLALQSVFILHFFTLNSAAKRHRDLLAQKPLPGKGTFNPANYDVEFKNVSFSYGDAPVIKNLSFKAKQGEITALVGPSGGGKSTVGKLSARFWDPTEGTVSIGGVDLKTVQPEELLKQVSIVFQDVILLDESVKENIRLGRADATDEEVLAAAHAAQCDDFIALLPEGIDTLIGENGSRLSGGERQRISIARALLKNAPLILLDEATASLDADNETRLQNALSKLLVGKTVLVIAHRMRTVLGADHIVALKEGQLAEEGSPEELMNKDGLFAHMVKTQNRSADWKI